MRGEAPAGRPIGHITHSLRATPSLYTHIAGLISWPLGGSPLLCSHNNTYKPRETHPGEARDGKFITVQRLIDLPSMLNY